MAGSPIYEGDIEIQLVESEGEDAAGAATNGAHDSDRLEHFYTALNWVKQELAELKEQDQTILQNFLSVRNTLYNIWETHRLIVKDQEEMKYYDDKSNMSPPRVTSPVSLIEKEPLARLDSGLLTSIQRHTEEKGIVSPITRKPLFTEEDFQESNSSNDIGPAGSLVSETKPWYEAGSSDTMEHPPKPAKGGRSYLKNSSRASINYKKKEHIYESIDDVLAELRQNEAGSSVGSPSYATLHKWTNRLTSPGSTSGSSSGLTPLDSKLSASLVSSKLNGEHDAKPSSSSIPFRPAGDHRYSSSRRPNSAKERRSYTYSSGSSTTVQPREGSNTPPPLLAKVAMVTAAHPPDATRQVKYDRHPSHSEVVNSVSSVTPQDVMMMRSSSARWVRQQPQKSPRSQSPTTSSSSMHKDSGYLTPQLARSLQNGMQFQAPTSFSQYSQDECDHLAEENFISLNFSNEVLSSINFLSKPPQQQLFTSPADQHASMGSRSASSSSTSSHGRRSVPLKSSPSPDLSVNPLGGPRVSPPPDNQPSAFCYVPKRGRSYSGNTNLPSYQGAITSDALPKLNSKRSVSGSQNSLLSDGMLPEHHVMGSPTSSRSKYHSSSPGSVRKDNGMEMLSAGGISANKGDIVDCPNSPRFPRRQPPRSSGKVSVYKGPSQSSQQRAPIFVAPPPPTVAPPKSHQQPDHKPMHMRQTSKVEQTWC